MTDLQALLMIIFAVGFLIYGSYLSNSDFLLPEEKVKSIRERAMEAPMRRIKDWRTYE